MKNQNEIKSKKIKLSDADMNKVAGGSPNPADQLVVPK